MTRAHHRNCHEHRRGARPCRTARREVSDATDDDGRVEAAGLYAGFCRSASASDGHFSWSTVTRALMRPTRGVLIDVGCVSPLAWPCSSRGLPCRARCRTRGGLLLHRFTLSRGRVRVRARTATRRWFVFCGTLRHGIRAQELPGGLPNEPGRSSAHQLTHRDRPADCFDTRKIPGPPRTVTCTG